LLGLEKGSHFGADSHTDTRRISYSFGGAPPLELDFAAGLLDSQVQISMLAFEAFKKLVREQEAMIAANNPDPATET
jgi:hypothetical protein